MKTQPKPLERCSSNPHYEAHNDQSPATEPHEYPNPTESDLKDPDFEAVWNAIKEWYLSRHHEMKDRHRLYSSATGNDVMHIPLALKHSASQLPEQSPATDDMIWNMIVEKTGDMELADRVTRVGKDTESTFSQLRPDAPSTDDKQWRVVNEYNGDQILWSYLETPSETYQFAGRYSNTLEIIAKLVNVALAADMEKLRLADATAKALRAQLLQARCEN